MIDIFKIMGLFVQHYIHTSTLISLVLLIFLDTVLGISAAIKNHELSSKQGRMGFISKLVELITCIVFDLLIAASPDIFMPSLAIGIYTFFILFELVSVAENLSKLGYDIPVIKDFINTLKK